jgi:hypothetical protein
VAKMVAAMDKLVTAMNQKNQVVKVKQPGSCQTLAQLTNSDRAATQAVRVNAAKSLLMQLSNGLLI